MTDLVPSKLFTGRMPNGKDVSFPLASVQLVRRAEYVGQPCTEVWFMNKGSIDLHPDEYERLLTVWEASL